MMKTRSFCSPTFPVPRNTLGGSSFPFIVASLEQTQILSSSKMRFMLTWRVGDSFNELERVYLEHSKNDMGHDRVWVVGPLLPFGPN